MPIRKIPSHSPSFGEISAPFKKQEKDSLRFGITLTSAALLLAACSPSAEEVQATPKTPDEIIQSFEPSYGECNPQSVFGFMKDSPEAQQSEAQKCLDVYNAADIAMVNYTLSPEDAEKLADSTEKEITIATMGIIKPEITVVEPSEEATAFFEKQTENGCIDHTDLYDYGSYAADATMPELNDSYDRVIGITNKPACQNAVAGVAFSMYNRYAEVMKVGDQVNAIKANDGKTTIETKMGVLTEIRTLSDPVQESAHEILHTFSIGHSGELFSRGSNLGGWVSGDEPGSAAASGNRLNLVDYFATGNFREYASENVMGNSSQMPQERALSLPQISLIEWPQQILSKERMTHVEDPLNSVVNFTRESSKGLVALLQLPEALPLPQGDHNFATDYGVGQKYDRVAFIRSTDYQGEFDGGLQVLVVGSSGNIIDLGKLYKQSSVGGSVYQIETGALTTTVTIDEETATVSTAHS